MPQILFLKGIACPYDRETIELETASTRSTIANLKNSGADVIEVGSTENGFTLEDLRDELCRHSELDIIIADIHGGIDDHAHTMAINSKERDVPAVALYMCVAEGAEGRSLNVFTFSCGSGDGCVDAVEYLPLGSTMVNLAPNGILESYMPRPHSFKINPPTDLGFAETLFINITCNGLETLTRDKKNELVLTTPQLCVSALGAFKPISNLWDLVIDECNLHGPEEGFTPAMMDDIKKFLGPFTQIERIEEALATFELCRKAMHTIPEIEHEGSPIKLFSTVTHQHMYEKAVGYDVYEVMCAIAYYLNRDKIGAFQNGAADFYITPARRTISRERFGLIEEVLG